MTRSLRLTVLLCLSTFLCTCGPAQIGNKELTTITGTIRYEESPQLLEANLTISPVPPTAPAMLGTTLNPVTGMGAGRYRGRQQTEFPSTIDFSISGQPGQVIRFSPPFADSIPAVLSKNRTAKIPAMKTGLADNESLVLFLEPKDRSTPKRILLHGPTSSGTLTLPKRSISDVKPGLYQAYFIKQQLQKDSTGTLKTSFQAEYFTKSIPIEVKE